MKPDILTILYEFITENKMKTCSVCHQEKEKTSENFRRATFSKDGFRNACRDCERAKQRQVKSNKSPMTKEEFKVAVRSNYEGISKLGGLLSALGTNFCNAPDFSPANMRDAKAALEMFPEIINKLQTLHALSLQRGNSFYDEERKKLFDGTLSINRRKDKEGVNSVADELFGK